MIPSKVLQFPLASGMDEGVDPRSAKPGTLKSLKNYCWTKDGLLEKRNGTEILSAAISGGGSISSAKRIFAHGNQLCLISGNTLYSRSELLDWIAMGDVPAFGLTWSTTTTTHANGIQAADMGYTSTGVRVVAYVKGDPTAPDFAIAAGGHLLIEIIQPNGQVSFRDIQSDVNFCRVLINGANWLVVFNDSTGRVRTINSAGTFVNLRNDGRFGPFDYVRFDACMTEDGSGDILLVYEENVGNTLAIYRFTFAGVFVDSDTVDMSGTYSVVGVNSTDTGDVYVQWGRSGDASYAVHDEATLTQTLVATNLVTQANFVVSHVGGCQFDGTSSMMVVSGRATSGTTYTEGMVQTFQGTTGGVVAPSRLTLYARAMTKPFLIGSKAYLFMCDFSQIGALTDDLANGRTRLFPGNNTYLVEAIPDFTEFPHRYVGLMDLTIAGCFVQGSLGIARTISATEVDACLPFVFQAPPLAFVWAQGLRLAKITSGSSAPSDLTKAVHLGPETYLGGAVFFAYDSRTTFDFGFPRTTPIDVARTAAGGGGAMVAGDYRYQLVPVFPSAAGIKHRGPASPVVKYAVGATGTVALVWLSKGVAWKNPENGLDLLKSYVEIYRTEVNLEVEHKLTVEPTYNLSFGETLTDSKADANIAASIAVTLGSRPGIYVVGEYDDYAPPASITAHVHKTRLWVISGDLRTVWYSKNFNEDQTVAPAFNPIAILNFEENLTALGSVDEKLIVFSAENLWYISGDGPAVSGDGSDYFPVKIQTDVGCIDARSVVETPAGVMFQSQRGLYLLSRGLELAWIGKPVRDTLASYPVITSAVLIPSLNHVRFTCNNTAGTEGVVLNYDHVRGQWSVFEYTGLTAKTPIADACLFNEVWHFVTPFGRVYKEVSTTSLDDGVWATGEIETTEIFGDGPLSYQRIRRACLLGDRVSACGSTLKLAVESESSYDQTRTWTSAELTAIGSANIGMHIRRQKSDSIRLKWNDTPPTVGIGTGRGLRFSELGFEIAPKQGLDKRPAAQRK